MSFCRTNHAARAPLRPKHAADRAPSAAGRDRLWTALQVRGRARHARTQNRVGGAGRRRTAAHRDGAIAGRMGISRPSLREGLRTLAQKGLVDARTRRGTIVNARTREWNILDDDVLRWLAVAPPDPTFFMDLLEREDDRRAGRRAAHSHTGDPSADLRDRGGVPRHGGFHSRTTSRRAGAHDLAGLGGIIAATGNRMLIRFAGAIRTALLLCGGAASRAARASAAIFRWPSITRSLRRSTCRDADAAERAMRDAARRHGARPGARVRGKYPRGISAAAQEEGGRTSTAADVNPWREASADIEGGVSMNRKSFVRHWLALGAVTVDRARLAARRSPARRRRSR